jgi:hypothetical protein
MAYVLEALIGSDRAVTHAAHTLGQHQTVELPAELRLLPLASAPRERVRLLPEHFYQLHDRVLTAAETASAHGLIGYFEAEFFGGAGHQSAILWQDGRTVFGPVRTDFEGTAPRATLRPSWAFNAALRMLGVVATDASDEFSSVGLHRHRHTAEWLASADITT